MEIGIPKKKRKEELGPKPEDDESFGVFGELDVDPDSELPVHEQFTDNSKKLRKIRK